LKGFVESHQKAGRSTFPGCHTRPIILLLRDTGFPRTGFSSGPANELIEGIDGSRRGLGELLHAVRVTQGAKIQEHRHASAGLLTMDEGAAHKEVCKPVGAIGRVRDDVLGKRAVGFQEVLPPDAEPRSMRSVETTSCPASRSTFEMAPSPQAGSQMLPSKVSTERRARTASGGVG
jgi:hypothetical protein